MCSSKQRQTRRSGGPEKTVTPSAEMDQALVCRVKEGDMAAFEQLYKRHVGRVYSICVRLSGDVGRAEDLTQEVFTRTWMRVDGFRGESAFTSWLHRLAVNVVMGDWRSRSRREKKERRGGNEELSTRKSQRVEPGLRMDLETAITSLPEKARTVFVLHDIEGYRHEEISAVTGIAEGTSKAHLHWARKHLREALEK